MKEPRKRFAVIVTLEGLKKTERCYNRCWKCSPSHQRQSVYRQTYYLLSGVLAQKPIINFFFMKRESVCEQVLDFLHSSTGCSENSPLHIRKIRPHEGITLNADQLLHHIQTEKNLLQKCILATRSCFFKALTTIVLHGHSHNNFVVLHPDIFKTLIFWPEKFSMTFSTRFIFATKLH